MDVDVKNNRKRGLNILFNRATNDMSMQVNDKDVSTELFQKNVQELAAKLPDIEPDCEAFYPCLNMQEQDVNKLAKQNIDSFVRHAANVGRMLARLHVSMPIVATKDGTVINGIGRLEAAARKSKGKINVVYIENSKADFARNMLNLLSMDFKFSGDNADYLRYGAYRRARCRRKYLGTGFVFPVLRHKALYNFSLNNPEQLAKWKDICGDNVLDFGAGHGDETKLLQDAGITVTSFEPYPVVANEVSREKGRQSAMNFLAAVRKNTEFSAIFLSSVLNSVPFPEDREHILRIMASLANKDTPVFVAARNIHDMYWQSVQYGESINDCHSRTCLFPLSSENGTLLGDLASSPKIQKFFEKKELQDLLSQFFCDVTVARESSMLIATCRKPLHISPQDLAASLCFEFNLPYADGKRMGLASLALKAFSIRLGLDLEDM